MVAIRMIPSVPMNSMNSLRSQMDALFNNFAMGEAPGWSPAAMGAEAPKFPAINMWETEQAVHLEAELPGFRMDDLDITLLGRELTIRGRREPEQIEGGTYVRRERPAGEFARALRLPIEIDAENVGAKLANGVLTIELPKAPEAKPRKIQVQASAPATERQGE